MKILQYQAWNKNNLFLKIYVWLIYLAFITNVLDMHEWSTDYACQTYMY